MGTVRVSRDKIKLSKEDKKRLEKLASLSDDEIDLSDIPELDEEWFASAKVVLPKNKTPVTMRLDDDIVEWFKSDGKGYQTRINAILRAYVDAQVSKR